jgi:APA family basic amino acid/polyamine antiporter
MAIALVMGNMIGSGVFLLPASLASYGGLSLFGWAASTVGAVCLALVFARLARIDPAAGGPYAYTRKGLGNLPGFLVAWGYWISVWSTNAALAVALVAYLDPFAPTLVRSPVIAALMAIAALWGLTVVNIAGVRTAGKVQMVTTVLKILPLVLVGVAGLFVLKPEHFALHVTTARGFASGVTATTTLTLWAFLGLECATIPAGSIDDPSRTIPRATIIGTLLVAALYIVSTVGVMGALDPARLGQSTAPFADAARELFGEWAARAVAIGAAISCFGALNGWTLVAGQLPMAVANDGLFPRVFARLSSRGTPVFGIVVSSLLATALIGMNYSRHLVDLFTFIILLATLSTLVPYVCSTIALFVIDRRRSTGSTIVAAVALAFSLWAIVGAGADVIYWGILLLLAGVPVYFWVVRGKRPRGSFR